MDVKVRLRRIARIPHFPQDLSGADPLADIDRYASLHQVREVNRTVPGVDRHVIAGSVLDVTIGRKKVR